MAEPVTILGAGLAGCEAAWQLANRGIPVTLWEMKPDKMTPAHHSPLLGELVCSNSLRSDQLENAVGLLKEELRRLNSLILRCADTHRVAAGGALAVDRMAFSQAITEAIQGHPNITLQSGEVKALPEEGQVIVATGPLTADDLAQDIARRFPAGGYLHFYDAAAPLVTFESIDMDSAWFASRYDKGTADYINCPLTQEEYLAFCAQLKKVPLEQQEHQLREVIAMTQLEPVQSRLIGNLSKGYRQRVGLAQAILGYPPILILDEPTVGLDPKQIIEVRSLIHNLAKEHTVILSSHILSEVQAVCDQIIILHHGKLLANDTPEGLEEQLGGRRLLLTAKGDKEQVEQILSRTSGVQSAQLTQDGELTHGTLQLEGEDPRETLFFAFAQAGLPLLDFHLDETSLEQIFLGLTQEQPPVPDKPSRLRWRRKAAEPVAVVSADEAKEVPDESDL